MPAATTRTVTTTWETHVTRAHCATCRWEKTEASERVTRDAVREHVAANAGHIVAVDRGQTRYVKSVA